MIDVGIPYLENHVSIRDFAIVDAVMSGIGMASNHLVLRSIMVNRYENPLSGGKGPTMSMCKVSKRDPVGNGIKGGFKCLVTLFLWHSAHSSHHFLMSFVIEYQTTLLRMRFNVALMPG